ncbi:MAG: ABC transporter ATP-binding protein [Bacteroidia bacterium]
MIIANHVTRSYGDLKVLKDVSLKVEAGEVVSIVGPSGAGKSTLLHIIGTIDQPDSGDVTINNVLLNNLPSRKIAAFRNNHIGFIFQFHHLLPEFTALENVCIPAFIAGQDKNEASGRARELLGLLGLSQREKHKPGQLSGGEQQRVAVARALMNNPAVVLADEPSGNLDTNSANDLHKLFFQLRKQFNQTFIIVTHNLGLAEMADRQLTMVDGYLA